MEEAIELMVSAKEECETIALYLGRMEKAQDERTKEDYRTAIKEEMKHALMFLERATELTGIDPEDYEVEHD
nr:MAG TPA: encapsulated ferritin [Caudoviricetes sp.]